MRANRGYESGGEPTARRPRSRRVAGVILGLLVSVFGLLLWEATKGEPDGLDRRAMAWLMEHRDGFPGWTAVARGVTRLGNDTWAFPIALVVAGVLHVIGKRGEGETWRHEWAFFLGVMLSGTLTGRLIKRLVDRPRPEETLRLVEEFSPSFPSGHAVFGAILFGMLGVWIWRGMAGRPVWLRSIGVLFSVILAVLVGGSRVWLGVHYPSDVGGGLVLGLIFVLVAWLTRGSLARGKRDRACEA